MLYDNQTNIIVWNMAQLATALVPLMPDTEKAIAEFTEAVHAMPETIHRHWLAIFGQKIGLAQATPEDETLITDLLTRMANERADFTNTFRGFIDMQRARSIH